MSERLLYEIRGPSAWLTLNRPDKLNAMDGELVRALNQALDRAEADERVRVIVLRGAGRAFSAGFDLEDPDAAAPGDEQGLRAELQRDFDLIMRLRNGPTPVIAAVHLGAPGDQVGRDGGSRLVRGSHQRRAPVAVRTIHRRPSGEQPVDDADDFRIRYTARLGRAGVVEQALSGPIESVQTGAPCLQPLQ